MGSPLEGWPNMGSMGEVPPRVHSGAQRVDRVIGDRPAVKATARDRGAAGSFCQVYSTTLLDFDGGRSIEWAYVPAALLEWDEPDLDRTLQAMELQLLVELPSVSALPAAIVAMLESADSPDLIASARLAALLDASLATWSDAVDSATLMFAQFAAFSAVLPVEWTPIEKVPVPDAIIGASAAGAVAAPTFLALAGGLHGVALVLVGAGGVALGAVAFPLVAVGGGFVAWKLLSPLFRGKGAAAG
jgi:hypothetical protein